MKKGFTLLEILIASAIVSVVSLMALPQAIGFTDKSKQESALANAMSIFSIADSYLYEDILLTGRNSFGCADGCEINSEFPSPEEQPLVDLIKSQLPKDNGSFKLSYKNNGLNVMYIAADNTKGKYPGIDPAATSHAPGVTTRLKKSGDYPNIPGVTTTPAITTTTPGTTTTTPSITTSQGGYYSTCPTIYNTGIKINSDWPKAVKPWPKVDTGNTFEIDCRYYIAITSNVNINEVHSMPFTHPQVVEINGTIITKDDKEKLTDQEGNTVKSIKVGDVYKVREGEYYVSVKKNNALKHLGNTTQWIPLKGK